MSRGPHNRWLLVYLSKDMLVCSAILPAIYLHYPHLQRFLAELCRNDQGGPLDVLTRVNQISALQPFFNQEVREENYLSYIRVSKTLKFKPSFDTFCEISLSLIQASPYWQDTFRMEWFKSYEDGEQIGVSYWIEHNCPSLEACNCASTGTGIDRYAPIDEGGLEVLTRGALSSGWNTLTLSQPILPIVFGTGLQTVVKEQEEVMIFQSWTQLNKQATFTWKLA